MAPKTAKKAAGASNHEFAVGDVVLGRIKGYPPWPAKIVDPEKAVYLTQAVRQQKPAKATVFLVCYYDDGNYAWQKAGELKPLSQRDIEDYLSSGDKKKGLLLNAYKTAKDPTEWEEHHAQAMETAKKNDEARAAGVDELESETEAVDGGKKRKRKEPAKKNAGKKAKKAAHSEDELIEKPLKKSKPSPEEESAPGFKKCKEWRRELQKGFLSDSMPTEGDMPKFDTIFKDIEQYGDKTEYLEANKLPKVIKRIAQLDAIPRNAEFNIKERCAQIVDNWAKAFAGGAKVTPSATPTLPNAAAAPEPAKEETAPIEETVKSVDQAPSLEVSASVDDGTSGTVNGTSKMDIDEPAKAPTEGVTASSAPEVIQTAPAASNDFASTETVTAPPTVDVAENAISKTSEPSAATLLNANGEAIQPNGDAPPAESVA